MIVSEPNTRPITIDDTMPILALKKIARIYESKAGALRIFENLDLDMHSGEIIGLIGPSGSGKSSLLHIAGLLEKPTAGEIWIAGENVSALDEAARTRFRRMQIGFVYQFHHLLPDFNALDNVALPQMIAGVPAPKARASAGELLARLGLAGRAKHQPSQLSGGEQQRVAIARALSNAPKILLADEPTGNLDPDTSHEVFSLFRELAKERRTGLIVATHNFALAKGMDRALSLRDGNLHAMSAQQLAAI